MSVTPIFSLPTRSPLARTGAPRSSSSRPPLAPTPTFISPLPLPQSRPLLNLSPSPSLIPPVSPASPHTPVTPLSPFSSVPLAQSRFSIFGGARTSSASSHLARLAFSKSKRCARQSIPPLPRHGWRRLRPAASICPRQAWALHPRCSCGP